MERPSQTRSGTPSVATMRMLLLFYNTGLALGAFFAWPVLLAIATASPKRRYTVRQRLGWHRYPWQSQSRKSRRVKIWVHALSVGEVTAARALVEMIAKKCPGQKMVLTASTLTGYQTASRLFADLPVDLAYFPYDMIWCVRSVADKIDPKIVILVETDIWPNFMAEMKRRQVPVYLVNMRLSDDTWNIYRRLKWLAGNLFAAFSRICVQTPRDARRLAGLGVGRERLVVTGNIKFDGLDSTDCTGAAARWTQKLKLTSSVPMVVAGSTHEGEELFLLEAFSSINAKGRAVSMILAPRDPRRARQVLDLARDRGVAAERLSGLVNDGLNRKPEVIVVDYLGVLKELYSLAQVAFIGGSLVEEGGHNPLEAAVFGRPIVFGPDMSDFRQIAAWFLQSGGARMVNNQKELTQTLAQLLDDTRLAASMGAKARQVVLMHQGAVARTLRAIDLDTL